MWGVLGVRPSPQPQISRDSPLPGRRGLGPPPTLTNAHIGPEISPVQQSSSGTASESKTRQIKALQWAWEREGKGCVTAWW